MRASTAKKLTIPTFVERFQAISEELFDAPFAQRIEALKALDAELDHALDLLAEERRPKGPNGIPVGFIRMQMDQKGRGNLEAYIAAMKAVH